MTVYYSLNIAEKVILHNFSDLISTIIITDLISTINVTTKSPRSNNVSRIYDNMKQLQINKWNSRDIPV